MITYFNGQFLPLEEVHISPFDRGFLFADGVYEALTTYNGKLFQFDEHMQRLRQSLNGAKINFNGMEKLDQVMYDLMKHNNLTDSTIYLQITRGGRYPRMHVFPSEDTLPTIFISASPKPKPSIDEGTSVKVILEKDIRWNRCDIKSIMLLPSVLAKQEAAKSNAYEAVWVRDGLLKEGAHTNIFIVRDDKIYTPPLTNTILPGITRQFIIDLCRQNNIELIEEEIPVDELKKFSEFFITGTTTEIKSVTSVDDLIIADGSPGDITKTLQKLFRESTATFSEG